MNEKEQVTNVAEETKTNVAEETKTNEVVNEVANATVQGRDAIIKALKTNPNNFVQVVTIQGLTIEERQGSTGQPYNVFTLLINKGVKAAVKTADGGREMGITQAIQVSYYQLSQLMRRHTFYSRFVGMVDNAVAVGMAEGFFCGMQIEIIGEFVAAGVVGTNPFTRNAHDYNVKDYDRYVYHVVNVFEPKDALLLEEYRAAAVENRRMLMEQIRAQKLAAMQRKNLLASANLNVEDAPF
nr:MAG: hypothetical protein [Bacteriophage sp.]